MPWDGATDAFIIDTRPERARRQGIGANMIGVAISEARAAGCEWLHVDFDDELRTFYLDACGFTPTAAGVIAL